MSKEALCRHAIHLIPDFIALYQFGPHAWYHGYACHELDLAFLTRIPLEPSLHQTIECQLSTKTNRKTHLRDIRNVSSFDQLQIAATYECLCCLDEPYRQHFETSVYTAYVRRNEERRRIFDEVLGEDRKQVDTVPDHLASEIARSVARIKEQYDGRPDNFFESEGTQESILLNFLHACEASIQLALHIVRIRALGVPRDEMEAFDLLEQYHLLDSHIKDSLTKMVVDRTIALHKPSREQLTRMDAHIAHDLSEFLFYVEKMLLLTV